jgi:predicted permease
MNGELVLLVSVVASVATSAMMWWWLRAPLREMLVQLCERPGSTAFWSRYTLLMLVMAPLAVVVVFSPEQLGQGVDGLRRLLLAILLGHLAAFALVGRSLFKAVRDALERERAASAGGALRG